MEAPHTDCSWVAGAQLQRSPGGQRPPLRPGWELRPTGESFSFPFANTAEPGRQKPHLPSLPHLAALAEALTPPSPLLVLVLWRPPLDCLKRQLAAQPPRFWRADGLADRLKLAASSMLRAGAALHAQLLQLPPSTRVAIVQSDVLFRGTARDVTAAAAELASLLGVAAADARAALDAATASEQVAASPSPSPSPDPVRTLTGS